MKYKSDVLRRTSERSSELTHKKAKNPKKSLIKTMQTRWQDEQRMFVHIPKKRNFS